MDIKRKQTMPVNPPIAGEIKKYVWFEFKKAAAQIVKGKVMKRRL